MKIAFVGARDFSNLRLVRDLVRELPEGTIVVSGSARGVDRMAESTALNVGLEVESYPADWDGPLGRGAGHARNSDVVAAADEVVAFVRRCHDHPKARCPGRGWTHGTYDVVRKTRRAGKKLTVYLENGCKGVLEARS